MYLCFIAGGTFSAIVLCVMDDISRSILAQLSEKLDEFIKFLPFSFAILNRELAVVALSDEFVATHKPASSDLPGGAFSEIFPELYAHLAGGLAGALRGEICQAVADEFLRSDGSADYLSWTIRPWNFTGSSEGALLVYTHSATERIVAQRELRDQSTFIEALFSRSQIGLNLCQMDGLWLQSNPAFLDIIGYSREEADGGLTYWELTPERYAAEEERQLKSLAETGRYGPYEKEFIRKDGTHIPVRLNGFLIEREGKKYIWSFIEDIRRWKQLEQKLEEERVKSIQSSKLATLGEIAAGIAHEVNNPLAIIDGYLGKLSLLSQRGNLSTEELQAAIDQMKHATDRASKIVFGLRRFARQESGNDFELVNVQQIIDETLILCQMRLRNRGIELQINNSSEANFSANALELSQVLLNLINNAVDALEQSEVKKVVVAGYDEPSSGCVVVEVCDSGGGVPAEIVDEIFSPFFTTKEAGRGTGLGLNISQGIIERHNGELKYFTKDNLACFAFRIPHAGGG